MWAPWLGAQTSGPCGIEGGATLRRSQNVGVSQEVVFTLGYSRYTYTCCALNPLSRPPWAFMPVLPKHGATLPLARPSSPGAACQGKLFWRLDGWDAFCGAPRPLIGKPPKCQNSWASKSASESWEPSVGAFDVEAAQAAPILDLHKET